MTHQQHLDQIVARFEMDVREKYAKGQREHGGNLWQKPGLLRMLRDEVLDFVVYADTVDTQLRAFIRALDRARQAGDWQGVQETQQRMVAMLEGPVD